VWELLNCNIRTFFFLESTIESAICSALQSSPSFNPCLVPRPHYNLTLLLLLHSSGIALPPSSSTFHSCLPLHSFLTANFINDRAGVHSLLWSWASTAPRRILDSELSTKGNISLPQLASCHFKKILFINHFTLSP